MAIDEADTLAADEASESGSNPAASGTHRAFARGDTVGRYVMITRLGAGTMGEVWAAYDPELDRKLAVKLLHPARRGADGARRETRMIREAQALARLSHPNVVAIHDVGTVDGAVWLAMEFVEGVTLGAWCRSARRSWQEVLDVVLAAGRGLEAAHAVGLVHRDVKPENVMVGEAPDGSRRVRVMDFGLVRADPERSSPSASGDTALASGAQPLSLELTSTGGVLGTPAYMPPEQQLDPRTDGRGDQFGFCVTLWECLYGQRPFRAESLPALAHAISRGAISAPPSDRVVPAWLRRACERGLAARPSDRYAGMTELLAALSRGRARSRRRTMLLGASAIAAAVLGVGAWYVLADRGVEADCAAQAAELALVWPGERDDARARTLASLAAVGTGAGEQAAARIGPWLNGWASAWQAAREQTCRLHRVEHSWDEALARRADECLAERRSAFAALLDQLEHADAEVAEGAINSAVTLDSPATCADPIELMRRPAATSADPRTDELRELRARAAALGRAGRFEASHDVAIEALALAEAIGDTAQISLLRLQLVSNHDRVGRYAEAEQLLRATYREAGAGGLDDLAALAANALVLNVGIRLARMGEGLVWAAAAEVAAARLEPEHDGLRTAELEYFLAALLIELPDYERARVAIEHSLAIRESLLGVDNPTTLASLNVLGIVRFKTGDIVGALAAFERVLAEREALLGPDHNAVGRACEAVANAYYGLGQYERAIELHRRTVDIFERTVGGRAPDLSGARLNLATSLTDVGRLDEAAAITVRAQLDLEAELGDDHPLTVRAWVVLAQIRHGQGDDDEAARLYRRGLAAQERLLGPDHPDVGHTLLGLAEAAIARGELDLAERVLARARGLLGAALGEEHPTMAQVHAGLGDLALARAQRLEAVAHYERAIAILASTNTPAAERYAATLAKAEALLAATP